MLALPPLAFHKLRMVISRGGREQRQQQIPALRFAPLGMTIDLNRLT
jgi:hypothetical protein